MDEEHTFWWRRRVLFLPRRIPLKNTKLTRTCSRWKGYETLRIIISIHKNPQIIIGCKLLRRLRLEMQFFFGWRVQLKFQTLAKERRSDESQTRIQIDCISWIIHQLLLRCVFVLWSDNKGKRQEPKSAEKRRQEAAAKVNRNYLLWILSYFFFLWMKKAFLMGIVESFTLLSSMF